MTRNELLRIMPANGDDLPAAMRIVEMGYPKVAPVMRDMVRCMRVYESPVADLFAEFFATLGEPAADVIAEGLGRQSCSLRGRIFCQVLPKWPREAVCKLSNYLAGIATQPDEGDNDLHSVAILVEHRLAEREWLEEWMAFKKERMNARNKLLVRVEEQLKAYHQVKPRE